MKSETYFALREGWLNQRLNEYFSARPHQDNAPSLRMFEEGFKRGFDAGFENAPIAAPTEDTSLADPSRDIVIDWVADTATIFGIRYSLEIFRTWATVPLGTALEIVGRQDGALTVRRLDLDELRADRIELRAQVEALTAEHKPVAWRYKYKFRDIGETGAYEYHSHEFACVARMPKGEPLFTRPAPQSLTRPAWRTGKPQWTDDDTVRVIAVTAHDEFAGVQFHDIRASDFYRQNDDSEVVGTEVTQCCTSWIYRDELWPLPAAPQPNEAGQPTAENWLRTKYGAYRGHPEWRALEAAFNAGMAAVQKGGE